MWIYGSGFPKSHNISINLDKKLTGMKHRGRAVAHASTHHPDGTKHDSGKIMPEHKPISEEAKLWKGWHSHGLKPAYEPILVAMKLNEGSYAQNALKYGVAGLNIDGGRIGTEKISVHGYKGQGNFGVGGKASYSRKEGSEKTKPIYTEAKGRFPANIILDEEAAKMLDDQSGELLGGTGEIKRYGEYFNDKRFNASKEVNRISYQGKGGASRFFYVAKASKAERNMGLEGFEEKEWKLQGRVGIEGRKRLDGGKALLKCSGVNQNNHPTVKPLKLMEYLCLLTKTPTGGIVLDPFAGSGTTGIACKKTGRDFIGIEKEEEYCKIAEARIKAQPTPLL